MKTSLALLALVGASLSFAAGCATEAVEGATDEAAVTAEAAAAKPYKCTLTLRETIPVKKVAFNIVPGGPSGCTDDGIPNDQVTKTETFNEAPEGTKLLCASRGHTGGNGTGEGIAMFTFHRDVATEEFEMTPECDPAFPNACFAKLSDNTTSPFVMMSGTSADKSEKMALINGTFVPKLDVEAGTLDLSIIAVHTFVDFDSGESRGGQGNASTLAFVASPKIELSTSFEAREIDQFGMTDDIVLKCAR